MTSANMGWEMIVITIRINDASHTDVCIWNVCVFCCQSNSFGDRSSYMKPGLRWSWRRCHSWLAALWSPSPPPSCGSQTCRAWSCNGKTCVPAGWSACVWTNPTAAAGSGCPGRRMSNSWEKKTKAWMNMAATNYNDIYVRRILKRLE